MWSRQLFTLGLLALAVLATQSHVIHKRGLLSKVFGGSSKSNRDIEGDLPPRERSKLRELLKNPVVITMLSAAVGMAVQQALASRNMNDICDNKYVKLAYMGGNFNPQIQQILNMLGCNGPNRKYGNEKDKYNENNKYGGVSTTPNSKLPTTTNDRTEDNDDDNDNEDSNNNQNENNDEGNLQSALPPEKYSKLQGLLSIVRGEKGAKRNFIKNLFGIKSKHKEFKSGQKLPSSSYKLDKDDAKAMKDLEHELEQYNKAM